MCVSVAETPLAAHVALEFLPVTTYCILLSALRTLVASESCHVRQSMNTTLEPVHRAGQTCQGGQSLKPQDQWITLVTKSKGCSTQNPENPQ
jgi:hypothetical protein